MSKRVAVYARVSTTRQAENDISIPDQLAQAKRFCQSKGWFITREFIDAGASARDDKRPEFQNLMEASCIDPSPFDVVLVHSQSRFFRDVGGYVVSKRRLQKHLVALVSITQDFGEGASADFAETVIAASDALNSAETSKHVTRTMLENARQGFWNGAKPPFGYRTIAVEQRGQRLKKKLEIDAREAEIVRLVFKLFLSGDGTRGPLGIKDIVSWLNARDFKNNRGNAFFTSCVHCILTRETYTGTHQYNQFDSRMKRARSKEEWVAVTVPEIIPAETFARVQALLRERSPTRTPTRITNSEVLLTGLVRCESCGGALMIRTGKGGRYRYYACANRCLKGKSACGKPITVPEAQLDQLVIGALADRLLTPDRLGELLRQAQQHKRSLASSSLHRRSELRRRLKTAETRIARLYTAIADGVVADTELFRRELNAHQAEREECIRLLSLLDTDTPPLRQALSKQQAITLSADLKRRLLGASKALQRRYVRGLVSDIVVDREKAVISGSPAVIAAAVTSGTLETEVRSSVREWRALRESNPSCKIENLES
jgi:site-specific DNA recombinase